MTWWDARQACLDMDRDLVSISNYAHLSDVLQFQFTRGNMWIGLYNPHYAESDASWVWADGMVKNWRRWASSNPNYANLYRWCVYSDTSGNWDNDRCEESHKFACGPIRFHGELQNSVYVGTIKIFSSSK